MTSEELVRCAPRLIGEDSSGGAVIEMFDWRAVRDPLRVRFGPNTGHGEGRMKSLSYMGLNSDGSMGFVSKARWIDEAESATNGPRPPVFQGAPVFTPTGRVCAIVVDIQGNDQIVTFTLDGQSVRDCLHLSDVEGA